MKRLWRRHRAFHFIEYDTFENQIGIRIVGFRKFETMTFLREIDETTFLRADLVVFDADAAQVGVESGDVVALLKENPRWVPAGGLGQEMQRRLAVAPSRAQEAHRGTALSTADTDTSNPLGPHVDPIHPSAATHRTLARQQRHVVDLHSPAPPSSPQSGGSSTDTSHTSEHPRDDVTLEAAAFELDCYRL